MELNDDMEKAGWLITDQANNQYSFLLICKLF